MYYVPDGYQKKQPSRWYASLLIIMIPLFIFSLVVNAVTKVPDIYEWRFNKTIEMQAEIEEGELLSVESLEDVGIYIEPEQMAQQIADYIKGNADSLYTVDSKDELYDYYIGRASEFSEADYSILDKLRIFDNISAVFGIVSFICSLIIFWILVKDGYATKALYRKKFLWSMVVMFGIVLIVLIYAFIPPTTSFVNSTILGITEGTILGRILGAGILKNAALVITAGCLLVSLAVMYVTWLCTKSRDIFNERRYFR